MKTLLIRNIPKDIHRELKVKAAQVGRPIQGIVLELIKKYVGKEEER